jgi:hypothetical protein
MPRRLGLLVSALLAGCGGAPTPAPACPATPPAVGEKLATLNQDIDLLARRYDGLRKQNQAIEKLLGELGFKLDMAQSTVQQRVEMMHRFERAEASRTASFQRLRSLLATLAAQHKVDTTVEVRAGQIVVRIAERSLFDAKGRFRAEAAPLVWAVAEGLKELGGRSFQVAAEVAPAASEAAPAPKRGQATARPQRRRAPEPVSPWAVAAGRAAEVRRLLEGTGIPGVRLTAAQRPAAPPGAVPAIEIVVLPLRDELPRVHGTTDTAAARR